MVFLCYFRFYRNSLYFLCKIEAIFSGALSIFEVRFMIMMFNFSWPYCFGCFVFPFFDLFIVSGESILS